MTANQDLSAATADMAKSKPEPHWPVGLYAPGKYICICTDCGKQHIAAKRALHCADCTIQRLFNRIATDRDKMDAMVADHERAVQAAVSKAVDACAVWHDREAAGAMNSLHCGSENSEYRAANRLCDFHRASAATIRSRGVAG